MASEKDVNNNVILHRVSRLEKDMAELKVDLKADIAELKSEVDGNGEKSEKRAGELDKRLIEIENKQSSISTELRIIGGFIIAAIMGMIGFMYAIARLVLEHVINTGSIP